MNPRDRYVPLHELVNPDDPLERDGPVMPSDPGKTPMANCVRYMRTHPMYMPPNPWPEGMFLMGIDPERRVCCAFIMLISQFEEIPTEELFGLCNPNTEVLYFVPVPKLPASNSEAQNWINRYFERTPQEEFSGTIQYLETNGWWVRK